MSFRNHETFIRNTTIRADKFRFQLHELLNTQDYEYVRQFLDQFDDLVVYTQYQKEWLDTFLREFYYQVNVKYGPHNFVMEHKSKWQKCPICKKRVFSILSPNDSVEGSRTAEYRIFCLDCQWTYLIKNNVPQAKQSIYSFLKKESKHFNILI